MQNFILVTVILIGRKRKTEAFDALVVEALLSSACEISQGKQFM